MIPAKPLLLAATVALFVLVLSFTTREQLAPHGITTPTNVTPEANPFRGSPESPIGFYSVTPTLTPRRVDDLLDEDETAESSIVSVVPAPITPTARATPGAFPSNPRERTEAPPVQALRELAVIAPLQGNRNNGRNRSGAPPLGGGGGSDQSVPAPSPSPPPPSPTPTPAFPRVAGQARGYAMLALMHPKARATVEEQVAILLEAQVQDLYLSVLVDGTFSEDFRFLDDIIRRLNVGERSLTVGVYFVSGPTMRRWDITPIQTVFSQIEPFSFRFLIDEDETIRSELRRLAARAKESFELNNSLNPANRSLALVMLEDNLDDESYRSMRRLLQPVLAESAQFVRNPCPGCYEGNSINSFGDPVEFHTKSDFELLGAGDGYTLDGTAVQYPGEEPAELTLEELRALLKRSVELKHAYFGLWRAARQGLGDQLVHPNDRTYEVPLPEHRALEISLLREGLVPVSELPRAPE